MKAVLLTLSLLASSLPALAAPSTQQVWQHHIDSWVARDLDGIVADYDESSFMIVNNRVYVGTKEIREVFAGLFSIFDHGSNRIDTPVVRDRIVFITWHFTPTDDAEHFGTDTFVIENGKIAVQTIASPLYERYPETR